MQYGSDMLEVICRQLEKNVLVCVSIPQDCLGSIRIGYIFFDSPITTIQTKKIICLTEISPSQHVRKK